MSGPACLHIKYSLFINILYYVEKLITILLAYSQSVKPSITNFPLTPILHRYIT